MEEIITVDGRQFKLTVDRPLTAEQKAQTIAEIKKQTGCGSCGPRVAKMGNDWQYGGIKSMAVTCPIAPASGSSATPKASGTDVTMAATPVQGVAPYMITFRKTPANSYDGSDAGATETIATARLALTGAATNPTAKNIAEAATVTAVYTLDGDDINGATSKAPGEGSSITFASTVTDSCGVAPYQTCTNACKIFVACPLPVCDFVVS